MITITFLHSGNKDLNQIQQIVTSIKAANMAKQTISQLADLTMIAKKRMDSYQQPQKSKNNEKCSNCGKNGYYAQDCYLAIFKRKPEDEKTAKKAKRA